MPVAPRRRSRDPLRFAVGKRGAAIKRGRHLEPHPRPAARHARDEADVQLAGLVLKQAVLERDTGADESFAAVRGDWIRVTHRRYDAPDFRRAQRLDARRDRKSTRLNSSHMSISYAVFCLKKKKQKITVCYSMHKKKNI